VRWRTEDDEQLRQHPRMARTTHSARITGPVPYLVSQGRHRNMPLGPCLVERGDGQWVDIIWGASGQNSAALPVADMESAEGSGHLLLLD
jgi:hypothetical protein